MKTKVYFILTVLSLGFYSCNSELDTIPTDDIGASEVFKTTKNAEFAVNGLCELMYKQYMKTQGFNGEGTIKMYYGNYQGNHFACDYASWAPLFNQKFTTDPDSKYNYYVFWYYYMLIGNANSIIENIDGASGPVSDKEFIKAQALTFRAYCYTMLTQFYCYRWSDSNKGSSNGLPLRLDTSNGDLPISTLAKTYKQIYDDLDKAIELFTASGRDRISTDNHKPSKDVAYAIYARAALCKEDYTTAAAMARKAYSNYPLMDNQEYQSGFNKPNSEWIWSIYNTEEENIFHYAFFSYIASNSESSQAYKYTKCISKELYDKIPASDIRRGLFLDATGYDYNTSNGSAATNSDLWKKAVEEHLKDMYYKIDNKGEVKLSNQVYAYMSYKFKSASQPGIGHLNNFRSSEMYLIEAEAEYYQGHEKEARNLLIALNKNTGRNPDYACTKEGSDLLEEIKLYRQIELWGEGFDWFDMKRWGDPIKRKTVEILLHL